VTDISGAPRPFARNKTGKTGLEDATAKSSSAPAPVLGTGSRPNVIVVGAGIVGLCTAWHLAKQGATVTVFDPNPPGSGCSSGNAGAFSPGSIVPMATPSTVLSAPSMLLRPSSALHVPPRYWLAAAPWLFRFIASATPARISAASEALAMLYRDAIDRHKAMLAEMDALNLIRLTGHLHLYRNEAQLAKDEASWQTRRMHGIPLERLSRKEIEALEPDIAADYQIGMFLPGHGMTIDPLVMATTVAEETSRRQVRFVAEKVLRLVPEGGRIVGVEAGGKVHRADHTVVAAGMWSRELLRAIGYNVPLESQRGYHIDVVDPGVSPSRPVIPADRKVFITPMQGRLRVAGTVELLGLDAPPTEKRARLLLNDLAAVYPQVRLDKLQDNWMGHRPCLPDSLPVIGSARKWAGLWCAFGHGHLGLTGAAVTGDLIANLLCSRPVKVDLAPFSVDRF
jgi:D-amino-acid dehydrogenase